MPTSSENDQALPLGTRLGDYRLDAIIGHGGFGITYRAFDTQLAKFVAIKEYFPVEFAVRRTDGEVGARGTRFSDDFVWGRERFLDEARALARFRHAHIVPVLRYFEANGTAYRVMPYYPGKSLLALRQAGDQLEVKKVEFVGPQVGEELRDQGGLGLLLALGGVMLYLAFRFQWKFGLGAIISLIHDVIVTLGILSFFQITFDLTVLAALLAIIGYSLNDTIVVFDRVRENFRVLRNTSLIDNINISTTQTLLRTMATSISTLLAIGALLVFAGDNLFAFSVALFVGVTAGTYSSVYIANVVLVWLDLTVEDLIPPVVAEEVDDRP